MSSPLTCDIVIPIWNQLELTQRCLESILRCTAEPIRLILIDNGSEEPTRRSLDQFRAGHPEKVRLIRNEINQGYIKGVNQGIRAAQAPWVCLLNNDTIVTAGWLTEMLKVASADARIGLVNPTSNSLGFKLGETPLEDYAQNLKKALGQTAELSTALGFCLLARRSLFDRIGLLDESFGMGYFEDDDLSKRVKTAGLRSVRACGAYVFHEERGSFRHLAGTKEAFEKNKEAFEKRWGRRLRILWALPFPSNSDPTVLKNLATELAGQGHWLYFVSPQGRCRSEILTHSQISLLKTAGPFWRLSATIRLLARRKKPFDLAISDDKIWSSWIRMLGPLHQATLLESPTPEEIRQVCQRLKDA